jgi:hypothetical protein
LPQSLLHMQFPCAWHRHRRCGMLTLALSIYGRCISLVGCDKRFKLLSVLGIVGVLSRLAILWRVGGDGLTVTAKAASAVQRRCR